MNENSILIVDDNESNVKLMEALLASEGYAVKIAMDAEQAITVLEGFEPDLILMDLQLPQMDGLELTRRLKRDPVRCHIPIVALTAYAMKGDEEKALMAGCEGYITKPINTRLLPQTIAGYLNNRTDSKARAVAVDKAESRTK